MPIDGSLKDEIREVFEKQKANRIKLAVSGADERKSKLKRLLNEIMSNQDEICEAVFKDLRKSNEETRLSEIFSVTTELKHTIRKLKSWMRPRRVPTPLTFIGSANRILYESIGQSLIISPWNYPFQLAVGPLIPAVAAGNAVIIKPSEKSPNTSAYIEKMIENLFPAEEVKVFQGDAEVSKELTSMPFNHIFFTGSPNVGKLVMEAASRNLAKVTLELGGKSPAIVNKDADITTAAKRIAWGKFLNAGQTCIAPDYLLVHENVKHEFLDALKNSIKSLYGEDEELKRENNYCRMIDRNQLESVRDLLTEAESSGAEIVYGGEIDESDSFIAPTIIENVDLDSGIMKKEIFGPLLPVLTFKEKEELFGITGKNKNPLALYVFGKERSFVNEVLKKIPAGSSMVNDVVVHFVNYNLPFGGINSSGIGKSHGYYGFKAFSNEKSLMKQRRFSPLAFLYPPYGNLKRKLIDIVIKYF